VKIDEKPIIIIGAGPAGLSCAVKLAEAGKAVQVVESSEHVGGLSRSFSLWGQTVDLGPHRFFSSDPEVVDHWKNHLENGATRVKRLTRIHYRDRLFFYPLEPLDVLKNLGAGEMVRSVTSYASQRLFPINEPATLEDWVTNKFGRRLSDIFFRAYSEKLWGIPYHQIDADWAAQRIREFSLWGAVKESFSNQRSSHRTLADEFLYPIGGAGVVYESMAKTLTARGGRVFLKRAVTSIQLDPDGRASGVTLADGETLPAQTVVSTMPITQMLFALPEVPPTVSGASRSLRFRNTILCYLEVDRADLFPDNWIYVHSPHLRHGRITNFRNWCPSLYGNAETSILCMEFWCFEDDATWHLGGEILAQLAQRELRSLWPRSSFRVLNHKVVKIPRSYPLYEIGYRNSIDVIRQHLQTIPNLIPIGRYGSFKYNNQDHSLLMGLRAADQILTGRDHRLWDLNCDSVYQEAAPAEAPSNLPFSDNPANPSPRLTTLPLVQPV